MVFLALKGFGQNSSLDSLRMINQALQVADSLGVLDSLQNNPDLQKAALDSLNSYLNQEPSQTANPALDSMLYETKSEVKGDVETTIEYQSRDSILFDLTSQEMFLYGESEIVYGDITLTAERIDVDWAGNTLNARFVKDDSTGRKIGKPIFKEANDLYETDDMIYNFKSRRAMINGIITEQDGAIMHGDRVKKNEVDELFIRGAKYTTCDLADPHFHIQSTKLKVIPNDKVMSGPFNLYFGDIPTPLGFLFGMFPQPREKASGIIFPSWGEDRTRGFFLRQFGYYFDVNEYMDLKLTGDIYSKGSWGVQGNSNYRVRYKFRGNMNVRYNKTVSANFDSEDFAKDLWVTWSHNPESFGTSRFSASVSGGTNSFTQNNNNLGRDYNSNVNAQFSSNVSYSKTFKGTPFSLTANARHTQNISTGLMSMTLPEVSLNATRMTPFKNVPGMSKNPLGKLGFSYRMAMKNEITNAALPEPNFHVVNEDTTNYEQIDFNMDNLPALMERAKQGMRHQIPINTSFNMLKYFTVSPSFNYTEVWYPKELKYSYDDELNGVRIDTLQGFSREGWWSTGASMATRLYGFLPIGGKKIQAIRHVMTPNIGFSYSPNFADPSRGVFQEVQVNEEGDTRTFSKYQNFAYGGPTQGENASLSFSLSNNLEMKVKSKNDSIDEFEKIKLFDNLSFSTGYNFLADSFNLSKINWNARTSFFDSKLSLNLSGTVDPYIYVLDSISESSRGDQVYDRRLDQFAWNSGQGLGQLERMTVAIGANLGPKQRGGNQNNKNPNSPVSPGNPGGINPEDNFQAGDVNQFIATDANQYVPFDVPWNLRVNYSFNYSKVGFDESRITQTLQFGGGLSLTEKTNVQINSGYDLEQHEFTFTNIILTRDLHCWSINFNWVPFGPQQSYFFTIQVKSGLLKDLKYDRQHQPLQQVF